MGGSNKHNIAITSCSRLFSSLSWCKPPERRRWWCCHREAMLVNCLFPCSSGQRMCREGSNQRHLVSFQLPRYITCLDFCRMIMLHDLHVPCVLAFSSTPASILIPQVELPESSQIDPSTPSGSRTCWTSSREKSKTLKKHQSHEFSASAVGSASVEGGRMLFWAYSGGR